MATLFKRLNHYCVSNKKPELSPQQKQELGKLVADKFFHTKNEKQVVHHATFTNESGTFRVVAYPKWFCQEVDSMINDYYSTLPTPRKRTRIPAKIISVKPSNNQL